MEVSGQLHAPDAYPLVPFGQEAGCAPQPVWGRWQKKIFAPVGNGTAVVHAVAIVVNELFRFNH
jgi:hypothetical protein